MIVQSVFLNASVTSWLAASQPWVRHLINPATFLLLVAAAVALAARRVSGSARAALLAGGAVVLVAVAGFGIMGWCRGPDWVFYWPWEVWPRV